ncbi:hypothetical protein SKAU_G00270990 [Synaphobranchus kaupii]|uniref:Uncharacterized protein n=1 Tax=Synaphobranchus kaupii TaxID=118154 RepID=A0A9Q1IPN5_SYNKA|nr:hypothetical protein SKAU_G00270990 [Synaphobranchus kaupii]
MPFLRRRKKKPHKMAAAFGKANMSLEAKDWAGLKAFVELGSSLPRFQKNPTRLFFDGRRGEMRKLGEYFTMVWTGLQVPGVPTLTDVRTALSTYTDKTLQPKEQEGVANMMCHDVVTAKRFYVMQMTPMEAAEN